MSLTRRQALGAAAMTTIGVASASCAPQQDADPRKIEPPAIDFGAEPLLNRERAIAEMERTGVDAIIAARPLNIYYLTNYHPQLSRMGFRQTDYAILKRNGDIKPILITGHFIFYLTGFEDVNRRHTDVRVFTGPAEAELYHAMGAEKYTADIIARPARAPTIHQHSALTDFQNSRLAAASELARQDILASAQNTLLATLKDLGLEGKTLAVDDLQVKAILEQAEFNAEQRDGDHLLRSIRLQRTAGELAIHRYAVNANAQAGLAAARTVREGASLRELRSAFATECAKRSLSPTFMVIDHINSSQYDAPLHEGQAFMIDCVSGFHGYLGDYGRTVFVGEPSPVMKRTTRTMSDVWDQIRDMLKPGVRYSEIRNAASEASRKSGIDAAILCTPHIVGLHHTDEPPEPDQPVFVKQDITLKEGMVLSVDLPVIDLGLGGSAHLEDLVLIAKDGPELLNDTGDRTILV